jgi:hypothetical protein
MDCEEFLGQSDENHVVGHKIHRPCTIVVYEVSNNYMSWIVNNVGGDRTIIIKRIQKSKI